MSEPPATMGGRAMVGQIQPAGPHAQTHPWADLLALLRASTATAAPQTAIRGCSWRPAAPCPTIYRPEPSAAQSDAIPDSVRPGSRRRGQNRRADLGPGRDAAVPAWRLKTKCIGAAVSRGPPWWQIGACKPPPAGIGSRADPLSAARPQPRPVGGLDHGGLLVRCGHSGVRRTLAA